jgi:hypothetical protein
MTFGYVIQFGMSSPICFVLALAQAILARTTDAIRMAKFMHINVIGK